jgi:hypothetical protein
MPRSPSAEAVPDARVADARVTAGAPPGPLALAVWASALRCVLVYLALPALVPVLGPLVVVTIPIVLACYVASIWYSVVAVRVHGRAPGWLACGVATVLLALNALGLAEVVAALIARL